MSYDIKLVDPVTEETLHLPFDHVMTGGTFAGTFDPVTGEVRPRPIPEAWLNVTYNYARYYYDAAEGDDRFLVRNKQDPEHPTEENGGIRGLYGKTGAESIGMLEDMIQRIEAKYRKNGEWIITDRNRERYFQYDGTPIHQSDVIELIIKNVPFKTEKYVEKISEGPNSNYWEATAANAIRPLHMLIAMARLRPDGVWSGD